MKINQFTKTKSNYSSVVKFIAVITVLTLVASALAGCGGEKIIWQDLTLSNKLPEPPILKGEIQENSDQELWIDIIGISPEEFKKYIEECQQKGFTTDIETDDDSFEAYDNQGYFLNVDLYESDSEMSIQLEVPIKMEPITWPDSIAGKKLPTPKSNMGNFSYEYEDSFCVYLGSTNETDYANYVTSCSNAGFNSDYNKGDDYYYAYNNEGWYVSICYEGFNTMMVKISAPSEDDTPQKDTEPAASNKEPTESEDLNPDFKTAMDSYEKFINEYVEFMKKYKENPNDFELLSSYTEYISKYSELAEDFKKWESQDMNAKETAYYTEVQIRVSEKLLEAAD